MSEYERVFLTGSKLDEAVFAELGTTVIRLDLLIVMGLPLEKGYRMEVKRWSDKQLISCEIIKGNSPEPYYYEIAGSFSGIDWVAVIGNAWLEYRHNVKDGALS